MENGNIRSCHGVSRAKARMLKEITDDIIERQGVREGPDLYRRVLDVIRPKRHPLHDIVNWDDTEAAELYRIEQIRYHLKSLVITYETKLSGASEVKYLNSIFKHDDIVSREFYTDEELSARTDVADAVKIQIVADAIAFVKKYGRYVRIFGGDLRDIIDAINSFLTNNNAQTAPAGGGRHRQKKGRSCKKKKKNQK